MRLKKINFDNNHRIFPNAEIELTPKDIVDSSSNYTTIIIGCNGTGKSRLLGNIIDTLIFKKKLESSSKISLLKDQVIYDSVDSSEKIIKKILAVTNIANDKFPFPRSNNPSSQNRYHYLGLKSASNNIFLYGAKSKLLTNLLRCTSDVKKSKSASKFLAEISIDTEIAYEVVAGSNYKAMKSSEINSDKKYTNSKLRELAAKKDLWPLIEEMIKKSSHSIALKSTKSDDGAKFNNDLAIKLIEAKVISPKNIILRRKTGVEYAELSSGEQNLIQTMLSIIAIVEDDSLIAIDEPEVSLHPNWQMCFLKRLDEALNDYSGCHIIIATHSHFILSNLSIQNGSVVVLEKNIGEKTDATLLEDDCYGWPAEQILYRAFGVTGFANKYIDQDLRTIIKSIKNRTVDSDMKNAYARISKFNITKENPIWPIIEKARNIIKNEN